MQQIRQESDSGRSFKQRNGTWPGGTQRRRRKISEWCAARMLDAHSRMGGGESRETAVEERKEAADRVGRHQGYCSSR